MGDVDETVWRAMVQRGRPAVWALAVIGVLGYGPGAQAQITPDDTLGSSITSDVLIDGLPADLINGGTEQGSNLFHSFSDFNVGVGQRVYFASPDSIANILSRVTGASISNIDGLLGVDGAANLFLLNPNGIVFGPGAELDLDGSFTASTAESITFADGGEFRALPTGSELLTFSTPLGVQFNHQPQGDISNQGDLAVGAGESLTLFGNSVLSSGSLSTPGGTVQVLGNQVGLVEQSSIDVSAATGGGTVLIGGDYQGEGTIPRAARVYVSPGSVINADALDQGEGGRVIVWADEANRFYGHISAQGGETGGNGGFAEVSARDFLDFAGTVDLSALQGLTGTLLLDPDNIEIVAGVNNPLELTANDQFADPGLFNTISNATINAATANVVLQANNDITFSAPINIVTPLVGLTAQANNNIAVNAGITTNGGALNLLADTDGDGNGSIVVNQPIFTTGGDIRLNGANALGGDGILTTAGGFLDSGGGSITLDGTSIFARGIDIVGPINSQGGRIELIGTSNNTEGIVTFAPIVSAGGDIFLDGLSTGVGTFARGIALVGSVDSAGGDIVFIGSGANAGISTFNDAFVSAGTGNINFIADNPLLLTSILGSGDLQIQPLSPGLSVDIGGGFDPSVSFLSQAELNQLGNGFDNITIGRADGTGTIFLAGDATFFDPTTLLTAGIIDTNSGFLAGLDNASLSLQAGAGISTGSIFTDGNAVSLIGDIDGGNNGSVIINQAISTLGGEIDIVGTNNNAEGIVTLAPIDSGTGNITLTADDPLLLNTISSSGNLQIQPLSPNLTIDLGAVGDPSVSFLSQSELNQLFDGFSNITIGRADGTGNIVLAGDVIVSDPTTFLTSGTIDTSGGNIIGFDNASLRFSGFIQDNSDALIITTTGDVALGDYFGQALTVESLEGSITANNLNALGAPINLNAAGNINVQSTDTSGTADSGALGIIAGGNVTLSGHFGQALGTGSTGGDVSIQGESVTINGDIDPAALAPGGTTGNTLITSTLGDVVLSNGRIYGDTGIDDFIAASQGGDITLNSAGNLILSGFSLISTYNGGGTGAGNTELIAGQNILVTGNSSITTNATSGGDAGQIFIGSGGGLEILDGSSITTNATAGGTAGEIVLDSGTSEAVLIDVTISSGADGGGNAGQIVIDSDGGLNILGNNSITTNATAGGTAGQIVIDSDGGLNILGSNSITTNATAGGTAGQIFIGSNGETLLDGVNISSSVDGGGIAGAILLNSNDTVTIVGNSSISTDADGGTGGEISVNSSGGIELDGITISANTQNGLSGGIIDLNAEFLSLQNNSRLDASFGGSGEASDITITTTGTKEFEIAPGETESLGVFLDNSTISAIVEADSTAPGGAITINTDAIALSDGARIQTQTRGDAQAGDVVLNVARLVDIQGSNSGIDVSPIESAGGDGGSILINNSGNPLGTVTLSDNGFLAARTQSGANAGNIAITTGQLNVTDGGVVSASTSGTGAGGSITLSTSNINLNNGGEITASTAGAGAGAGGNILFNPSGDTLRITGNGNLSVETSGSGSAGIFADLDNFSSGNPIVEIANITVDEASLSASTSGSQSGGDIIFTTSELSVVNGGQIAASTSGAGAGGSIAINISDPDGDESSINLDNGGRIAASTSGEGAGGSLTITNTDDSLLTIQGNGFLSVDASSPTLSSNIGRAGDLTITGTSSLSFESGVTVSAESNSLDGGGNITIQAGDNIAMGGGSFINALSRNPAGGKAGNIDISADGFFITLSTGNNDIIANAVGDEGGNVTLSATRIFGLLPRSGFIDPDVLRNNTISDISASSQQPGLNGTVTLLNLAFDPTQGLNELPISLSDQANQIAQGCRANVGDTNQGEFVITGRGGLPSSPGDPITASFDTVPWVTAPDANVPSSTVAASPVKLTPEPQLLEAQGWMTKANGEIFFVADPSTQASSQTSGLPSASLCSASR